MKVLVALLVGFCCALARGAGGKPGYDRRIKYVTYDAEEVVTLDAVIGVATHIVLEPGEKYVTHAFGDGRAWSLRMKEHHCFVKPVAAQADSNLTLVTDRRSYHFALKMAPSAAQPTYEVIFEYPESRKAKQEAQRRALEHGWARPTKDVNLYYSMSGDLDIAPINAWDNREFTYFKFAGARDIPAIYMVDPEGVESIVNRHSEGAANEIVVVHKVAPRWVLRLGSRALAIWNDGYDGLGRRNVTGTVSGEVERELRRSAP